MKPKKNKEINDVATLLTLYMHTIHYYFCCIPHEDKLSLQ